MFEAPKGDVLTLPTETALGLLASGTIRISVFFKKDFIFFRERGRERKRQRGNHQRARLGCASQGEFLISLSHSVCGVVRRWPQETGTCGFSSCSEHAFAAHLLGSVSPPFSPQCLLGMVGGGAAPHPGVAALVTGGGMLSSLLPRGSSRLCLVVRL